MRCWGSRDPAAPEHLGINSSDCSSYGKGSLAVAVQLGLHRGLVLSGIGKSAFGHWNDLRGKTPLNEGVKVNWEFVNILGEGHSRWRDMQDVAMSTHVARVHGIPGVGGCQGR